MRISDWSSDVCSSDLGVGIEQFVVPDHFAANFAERLVPFALQYGFVTSHSDIKAGWRPAVMPTAIFLDRQSRVEVLVEQIERWSKANPDQCLLAVAPPDTSVRGMLIVNFLSSSAPFGAAALDRKSTRLKSSH